MLIIFKFIIALHIHYCARSAIMQILKNKYNIMSLIKKYKDRISKLQKKRKSFELKGMGGACISITGEIQAYNAVVSDLIDNNKEANEFIKDIANLLGMDADGIGYDEIQYSIDDFKEAIDKLREKKQTI